MSVIRNSTDNHAFNCASLQIGGTTVLATSTLGSSITTSSLTTVGALNSGSITSGFGQIDNGSSNLKSSSLFVDTIEEYTVGGVGIAINDNIWVDSTKWFSFFPNSASSPPEFSVGMNGGNRDLYFSGTGDVISNGYFRFGYWNSTITAWIETLNLNNYTQNATFAAKVTAGQLAIDNIDLNGNTISSTDTNGNLVLAPNGTGNLILSGKVLLNNTKTSTGPAAINLNSVTHAITTTGTGDAFTLADGIDGQILTILYAAESAGGDTAIITPTNLVGSTTITLNAVGNTVKLYFYTGFGWFVIGGNAYVLA